MASRRNNGVFVVVPEIRGLTVSDIRQTSVTLSWSIGNTQQVDNVQVDQRGIDSDSAADNRRFNASSNSSHKVTTLKPGTTYEFHVLIQSYGHIARTDSSRVTTGATTTGHHYQYTDSYSKTTTTTINCYSNASMTIHRPLPANVSYTVSVPNCKLPFQFFENVSNDNILCCIIAL